MNTGKLGNFRITVTAMFWVLAVSCSDDPADDQTPGPGPGPSPTPSGVTVTSVTEGAFWNDEITLTGTGFSATKTENLVKFIKVQPASCSINYTSDGGDIEIISATATTLKIKVPARYNPFGEIACGPEVADIEVTVNGKSGTFKEARFSGVPRIGKFLYHYGGFADPNFHPLGDSVIIAANLLGSAPKSSPYWNKLRLSVDGQHVPFKWRTINLNTGAAFILPAEDFRVSDCPLALDGYPNARKVKFKFYIQDTDKESAIDLYIQKVPTATAGCSNCKSTLNKTMGEKVTWKIEGQNMSLFTKARYSPANESCGPPQDVAISGSEELINFEMPSSILAAGCQYTVFLVDHCDGVTPIGSISVQ